MLNRVPWVEELGQFHFCKMAPFGKWLKTISRGVLWVIFFKPQCLYDMLSHVSFETRVQALRPRLWGITKWVTNIPVLTHYFRNISQIVFQLFQFVLKPVKYRDCENRALSCKLTTRTIVFIRALVHSSPSGVHIEVQYASLTFS